MKLLKLHGDYVNCGMSIMWEKTICVSAMLLIKISPLAKNFFLSFFVN